MAGAYPAWRRWQGLSSPNESRHSGGRAAHPLMMVSMTMATKTVPHHKQYTWPPTRSFFDTPFSYPGHFVARNTHRWIMAALQQRTRTADKTTSLRAGLGTATTQFWQGLASAAADVWGGKVRWGWMGQGAGKMTTRKGTDCPLHLRESDSFKRVRREIYRKVMRKK